MDIGTIISDVVQILVQMAVDRGIEAVVIFACGWFTSHMRKKPEE